MLWIAVGGLWVAFFVGLYAVGKPRFDAIERRREVVGDRPIPQPTKYLIFALVGVGAVVPVVVTSAVGLDAAGVLAGSLVLVAIMSAVVAVGLRATRIAQARRPPE